MAGIAVTATAIAMATPSAAATPMIVRKGMPATNRPMSAMMTVTPAKTTAEPAVAVAMAAAFAGSTPSRSSSR